MISKMTEPYINCGDTQIPTEKDNSVSIDFKDHKTLHPLRGHSNLNWKTQIIIEMITKMTDPYILCWDIQVSKERSLHLSLGHLKSNWKKTVQYPNDFKDDRTLHQLWGHSNSNWKKQFSIYMISKITELYILWGEIQILTEKDSLVLKWLQRWQNLTFFEGTFKFRLRESHIFCWDIQIQLEKTVQYPNDFKSDRNLHRFWGHSDSNWKGQFSIDMISKITELYISWVEIQIPIEKDSLVLKWLQRWQNLTFFEGTFKFRLTESHIFCWDIQIQLENTVQYPNDFKSDRNLHRFWGHSNSNWKRQFSIEMISKITELYILCGTFKSQLKITVYYWNGKKDDKN